MIFAYLRVSSQGQVNGDGLDRQRDAIQAWVRTRKPEGGSFVREFAEEGFTGTSFERPVLGQMLATLRSLQDGDNPFGTDPGDEMPIVLVERSDRLARDNLASELILQEFRKLSVRVIDCEADLELTNDDDPSKVLIRQILQAVAEFDKSSLVKKLRKARDRKRRVNGRCEGAKPFGSMPGEEDALGFIKTGRSIGMSLREIRDRLNGMGLKSRSGRPWSAGTISKILQRIDSQGQAG